ncbi:MAG TPA: cupin-like domain-containing protein [Saprospiraceae bacterium]|nr:cupin-like domain-containing protein [Saprospiraceae bacterium]
MSLKLSNAIDRKDSINRETFQEAYMLPQKPVVIRNFYGANAPVYTWSLDYFKEILGHLEVGVYDAEEEERQDDRSYKGAPMTMKFGDYIELIQSEPTSRRLFLFNVFKHKKDLLDDFQFPDITNNVLGFLPFAFFGGAGAITRIHRDMDNSNVFLTELIGEKRVVLFPPEQSSLLYRYPFSTHTSIDVNAPDFEQYPGLRYVEGLDFTLKANETLFMPAGWWHHIEYKTAGMGFAMRSLSPYLKDRMRGLLQVGLLTHLDDLFRWTFQDKWFKHKKQLAQKRANAAMRRLKERPVDAETPA